MNGEPSWLDDEQKQNDQTCISASKSPPPVTSPRTTQSGRAALEEAGLGFLCDSENPELPMLSQTPPTSPPAGVVVSRKGGALIEPEGFVAKSNTSAPVHFLKRMQQAEAERTEKAATRSAVEIRPVPPPPRSKPPSNRSRLMTSPGSKAPSANKHSGPIGVLEQAPGADLTIIAELNEHDRQAHAALISLIGELSVRKLVSVRFQHRVEAHREILEAVERGDFDVAFLGALRLGVADPVLQVCNITAESLRAFLSKRTFLDQQETKTSGHDKLLEEEPVREALLGIAKECVKKLKEPKCNLLYTGVLLDLARCKWFGAATILSMVCTTVHAASGGESTSTASTSDASQANPAADGGIRSVMSRLDFAVHFIQSSKELLGKDDWRIVMTFAAHHLNASSNKVRKTAMSLVAYVHPIGGNEIFAFLTGVNASTMKIVAEELGEFATRTSDDMLKPPLSALDQVEVRQEADDLAASEADGPLTSESAMLVDLWGESLVGLKSIRCLFCSRWKVRERFMERLINMIASSHSQPGAKTSDEGWNLKNATVGECVSQILERALGDSVPPVASAALRALKIVLPLLSSGNSVWPFVDTVCPPLIKLATSPQSREIVSEIIGLALCQLTAGGVPSLKLFDHIAGVDGATKIDVVKAAPKLLVARMEILQHILMSTSPLDAPGSLTTGHCMEVATHYLDAPNPKVRLATSNFVLELHNKVGSLIHPYLCTLSGTPALEELRSRLSNAASNKKNAKAVRLFNMVQPLADVKSPSKANQADVSLRERIMQRAAVVTPGTPISPRTELRSPATPRGGGSVTPAGSQMSTTTPAPVTTPGRKSRLVFA